MKIHSLSKIIAFPLVIWLAVILYLCLESDIPNISYWLFPPVILLTVIYVLHPQINFWWYKRSPPELDLPVLKWLQNYSAYYNSLNKMQQTSFENRLSLFMEAKEFIAMGKESREVPEDLKAILSHLAIQFSFGLKDFLFKKYTRIIVYKHAFPSPRQKYLHSIEVHHEDGAIIISLEQLIPGILQPSKSFNIGLYAFADAWLKVNPIADLNIPNHFESEIPNIVSYGMEKITKMTGPEFLNRQAVFITLLFTKPDIMHKNFPQASAKIGQVIGQGQGT